MSTSGLWLSPGRDMCPDVHDAHKVVGSIPSAPTGKPQVRGGEGAERDGRPAD